MEYATTSEKQISRSNYILSLSIKITIFTFLNSAIVPLISKHFVLLIKKNDREEDKDIYNLRRERNNLLFFSFEVREFASAT